jgi:hypothetical protein
MTTIYSVEELLLNNGLTENINYYDNIDTAIIDIIIEKLINYTYKDEKPIDIYNYELQDWNYEKFKHIQLKEFFDNKTLCTHVIKKIVVNSKVGLSPPSHTKIYALVPTLGLKYTTVEFYYNIHLNDISNKLLQSFANKKDFEYLCEIDIPLEKIKPLKQLYDYYEKNYKLKL